MADGEAVGVVIRSQPSISGSVEVSARRSEAATIKLTIRILNHTLMTESELLDPEAVLERTFASTHIILSIQGGEFISSMDPGDAFKAAARSCKNIGTWPVLIGDEGKRERSTMLSSPIILYDYPKIAAESAGNLFDGTEIDEILSLRLQTLTDAEKFEMRQVDEHAHRLLERTDALQGEALLKMHGSMRRPEGEGPIEFDDFFGASTRMESVTVAGIQLKAGNRVRIRPNGRADVMDVALAGQTAIIEAIEQDMEKRVHLALVLENDPGKDLGMMRQPGHRFFYGVDEIEPLVEELT
jgi:hydrogenase maturation protease